MRANRFKHRHDVQFAWVSGNAAGQDGAAIDKDAGPVHACHGHYAGGHVLVTAANGHEAVHAFAAHHRLNGVGNHLTADQGIFHSLSAH